MDEKASKVAADLKEGAAETASDLAETAKTAANEAGRTIQGAATEASKKVAGAAAETYRQGVRASEYVSRNTADQPLIALLLAGAVGYAIAYLLHRPNR